MPRGIMAEEKKRYRYNPFREEVMESLVTGKRFIFASPSKENAFAMVSRQDGEDFGDIKFGTTEDVEKNQFLKIYADGVKMFLGLSSAGLKVFMVIFDRLLNESDFQADKIDLTYQFLTDKEKEEISETTFYRGIRELIKRRFLAPALLKGVYWINANYVFKGKKITLVKEYRLLPSLSQEERNITPEPEQIEGGEPDADDQDGKDRENPA